MPSASRTSDPDDLFADTRMSFGEHIEELRTHLLKAIYGLVIGFAISLIFAKYVFNFITAPVEAQLMKFYEHRVDQKARELRDGDPTVLALNQFKEVPVQMKVGELRDVMRRIGVPIAQEAPAGAGAEEWIDVPFRIQPVRWAIVQAEAARLVGRPPALSTLNVMEAFLVYFKVCGVTALVISSPWVFYQLWSFVAAGLYPHERRYIHKYLPISLGLFLAGVFLCQFMVIPKAINALLWFNEWLGLEPELRLNEWLSFALIVPLVFGISFQTPLVMLFLAKIGILDADAFRRKRRIAWFIMAIFTAIVTPVDALSMLLLWIPMCLLYELGILMVVYSTPAPSDLEAPSPEEEMVEV
jgi:sec-independent protein translocase protein TatC